MRSILLTACLLASAFRTTPQTTPNLSTQTKHGASRFDTLREKIERHKAIEMFFDGVAGFRPRFGGLASGSGFAVGPEYLQEKLAGGRVVFRGSARLSVRLYQLYEVQVTLPHFASERLDLDLSVVHRNYPGMQYYGAGSATAKTGRSNYRLEDTAYSASAAVAIAPHLAVGADGGLLQVNVGPGGDRRFASSETLYSPAVAPGIDQQTDFWRGGLFVRFDSRDTQGIPSRGSYHRLTYQWNWDRNLKLYSFRRLNVELQHYIPIRSPRNVIALRAKSELTWAGSGQRVPFYLQPRVGGPEDLRGFRSYRFYDDNAMVMNTEFRRELLKGAHLAVFADAGKVFHTTGGLNFRNLEGSLGAGVRIYLHRSALLRVDAGFSHEGYNVWIKFSNVF